MSLICRTCSQTKTKFLNLFNHYENNCLVSEMLNECTTVDIQKGDGLPLHICSECLDNLMSAWHFRRMTIETDSKLRKVFCKRKLANKSQHEDNDITIVKEEIIVKDEECNSETAENKSAYVTDVDYGEVNEGNGTLSPENYESSSANFVTSACNVRGNFLPATFTNQGIDLHMQNCNVQQLQDGEDNSNARQLQYVGENTTIDHDYASSYQNMDNSIISGQKLVKNLLANPTVCENNVIQKLAPSEAELKVNEEGHHETSTYNENEIVSLSTNIEKINTSQLLNISCGLNEKTKRRNTYFAVTAIKEDVRQGTTEKEDSDKLNNKLNKLVIIGEYRKLTSKEKKIHCRICNKNFSYRYYNQVHVRYHKGDLPHKCKVCEKKFPTPSHLKVHAIIHSETRPFACDACGKAFKTANSLQLHKSIHLDDRPYKCNICHLGFKAKSTLKSHRCRHENQRNYVCETCGKTFMHRIGLRIHLKGHLGIKDYLCTECGKPFSTSSKLRNHFRRNHTNERPYACAHCDKRFKDKGVMKKHSLIHTGEKPHLCKLCGKSFRQGAALRTHMRSHTGEAPYACKLCPSQFKYSQLLTNHMKTHK